MIKYLLLLSFYLTACLIMLSCADSDHVSDNNDTCTTEFVYGIRVRVYDEKDVIVTNAVVQVEDGEYVEILELYDDEYLGAGERPGEYTLEVERQGYLLYSDIVSVNSDECHVITEEVDVFLIKR